MDERISIITLGVADLDRAIAFYRDGMHLTLSKRSVRGVIAFFETSQTWLTLFQRKALAEDAGVPYTEPAGFAGFALAHNVRSKEAADAVMAEATAAGATITKPMHKRRLGRLLRLLPRPGRVPLGSGVEPALLDRRARKCLVLSA